MWRAPFKIYCFSLIDELEINIKVYFDPLVTSAGARN